MPARPPRHAGPKLTAGGSAAGPGYLAGSGPAGPEVPAAAAAGDSARRGAERAHLTAVAQALFVTVLWSSSWVLIAIGLRDLPTLTFAGLRYGLAALLLTALWAASSRHRAELAASSWQVRWELLVLGVVFYAIAQGAQFAAWRNHVDVDVIGEVDSGEWPYRQANVNCRVY